MDIKSDLSSLWDMIDAEFYYDDETYEQEEIYRDIRTLFGEDPPQCRIGKAYWEVQYSPDQMNLLRERSTYFAYMERYNPSDTNEIGIILPTLLTNPHPETLYAGIDLPPLSAFVLRLAMHILVISDFTVRMQPTRLVGICEWMAAVLFLDSEYLLKYIINWYVAPTDLHKCACFVKAFCGAKSPLFTWMYDVVQGSIEDSPLTYDTFVNDLKPLPHPRTWDDCTLIDHLVLTQGREEGSVGASFEPLSCVCCNQPIYCLGVSNHDAFLLTNLPCCGMSVHPACHLAFLKSLTSSESPHPSRFSRANVASMRTDLFFALWPKNDLHNLTGCCPGCNRLTSAATHCVLAIKFLRNHLTFSLPPANPSEGARAYRLLDASFTTNSIYHRMASNLNVPLSDLS